MGRTEHEMLRMIKDIIIHEIGLNPAPGAGSPDEICYQEQIRRTPFIRSSLPYIVSTNGTSSRLLYAPGFASRSRVSVEVARR